MLAIAERVHRRHPTPDDRRAGASRQRLLMRVAKLICKSGEYPCVMLDVSETGTKLRLFHATPPETFVMIELSNGAIYPVERRWTREGTVGFRFTSPVNVTHFINESSPHSRRPARLRTRHSVQFIAGGERGHAMMINLSARGACIEAGRQLPVGSMLKVEIGGRAARFAHVCWRKDYRHGLAFQEDMALADLARLAMDLQPFQSSQVEQAHPRSA
jgi:hypothetical protein